MILLTPIYRHAKYTMTTLVVLPGLDGTATLHAAFIGAAKSKFDSVAVIPYPPDQILDYEELETLVRAALPSAAPFLLLGESFSGPIALSIAADPPKNLRAVVLSTSFAKSPIPLLAPLTFFTRLAPVRSLPSSVLSWWLLGRWATPQLEEMLQNALLIVAPAVLRARATFALSINVSSRLPAIAVPLLYLRATEDRLLSRNAGDHILSAVPQCKIVDVAGPHLLLQAAPLACAQAVGDFAAGLG